MDLDEYKENVNRTLPNLGTNRDNLYHMLFGMMTEVGELVNIFKRNLAYEEEPDYTNVWEEIGDLMWYIQGFCSLAEVHLPTVLNANIEKLKERYPEKFTKTNAAVRNLDKERKVLQKTATFTTSKLVPIDVKVVEYDGE